MKRKPGLGKYNGNKEEWKTAYRKARINFSNRRKPQPNSSDLLLWKAKLIVNFDLNSLDSLELPVKVRLETKKIVDQILNEN